MATGKAASIARRSASKSSTSSTSSSSSGSSNVSSLAKQLSSVAAQAKSLGIDTSKADAMVKQTNRQGATAFAGSDEENAYNASLIKAKDIGMGVPTLPTPIIPTGTPNIAALNSALANPETGLKTDTIGGFTIDPVTGAEMASGETRLTKMLADLKAAQDSQVSPIDIQKKLDKQTGIDNLKKQEADYTGQLNSIVANSEAAKLSLEGQGRGQTTGFLGGEQARIGREAAIQALPVQAQLAAVQGKIQVAQDYINKWGTLLVQDATNKYNNQVKSIEAVYNFGTAQDKLKFDSLRTQVKEKKDKEVALATAKTKAISQALAQPGGSAVISAIQAATDENAVVTALGKFNGDVLGNQIKQAQLNKLNEPAAPTVTQISETIQNSVSDSNPTTVKSSLAALLGSPLIAPATKARISPSLAVLNSVDELANGNIEGQFTGVGVAGRIKEGVKGLFGYKNPEAITNAQNIEAINLKVQQWASGASLTEQQTKQVNKLTPTLNDRDTTVKTKLNGLYNFMLNQAESDLLTEGVNVQFPAVNLFEISDLYAKASPEQRTLIEQTYFKK